MTKLTATQRTALDEAVAALQPFYDPGDDGDAVRIALNGIAGLLGERFGITPPDDDGLNHVLKKLNADAELRTMVRKLYKVAAGGAYGEGLTKKDARKVNNLVQDLIDPLIELASRPIARRPRARRPRPAAATGDKT